MKLREIDLFQTNPIFVHTDTRDFHSKIGNCLTIFVSILSVLVIIYFSLDLITKENPQFVTSESYSQLSIPISPEGFYPTVGLFDEIGGTPFINKRLI